MNRNILSRAAVVGVATGVVVGYGMAPAIAADGDNPVAVTNTETVQVLMDANAGVKSSRVYEQIDLFGKGNVNLKNPIETNGLRNLDGFKGFDVKNGQQIVKAQVDGEERFRTVSSYKKDLPVKISVRYFIDGQPVEAEDVVGKSGKLGVFYKVENRTGVPQTLTYTDADGNEVEKEENVAIPMIGSMTVVAPSNFTDVTSKQANMAGDGRGGTQMSFTMTLFPPIGSNVSEFGYEAHVEDAVVPAANMSLLPVNPLESPSFSGGAASYKGGAETGAKLTAGAKTIDENLLKLRDGANELIAGLLQLKDGAGKLSAGLNNDAAPGAGKLAAGAGELNAGAGKLNAGAGDLSAGAKKLNAGAGALFKGTSDLGVGVKTVAKGASDLAVGAGSLNTGAKSAKEGSGQIAAGLSDASGKAPALATGLGDIKAGLGGIEESLAKIYAGANAMKAGIGTNSDVYPSQESLLGLVNTLRQGVTGTGSAASPTIKYGLTSIRTGVGESKQKLACAAAVLRDLASDDPADNVDPQCSPSAALISGTPAMPNAPFLGSVAGGLEAGVANQDLEIGVDQMLGNINGLFTQGFVGLGCGLNNTYSPGCDPAKAGLLQGAMQIATGVGTPTDFDADKKPTSIRAGVAALTKGAGDAETGSKALVEGLDKLSAGANSLDTGLGTLSAGTGQLEDGAKKLSAGVSGSLAPGVKKLNAGAGQLSAGTGALSTGAGTLAAGTGTLKAGTGQLSAGASKLAAGLRTAADGSGQIFEGLVKASAAAPAIPEGAQKLSDEGTKKLILAGQTTGNDYGTKYALIEAGAERAQTASMAYGAPAAADGLTAYKFELAGNDGEGSRTTTRGLAALALFAGGGALAFFRRRSLLG